MAFPDGKFQIEGESVVESFIEEKEHWVLSIRSNVYGSKYLYRRVFVISKNLCAVAVRDDFLSEDNSI